MMMGSCGGSCSNSRGGNEGLRVLFLGDGDVPRAEAGVVEGERHFDR